MREFLYRLRAHKKACREIGENEKSENHIEPFDPSLARNKRRANDKRDGHDIENEQPVPKLLREAAFAEIESTQLIAKRSWLSVIFSRSRSRAS
jgi:hypothetical protein